MYNRLLLALLTVSFLIVQNSYSQNLRIDPINPVPSNVDEQNFAQTPLLGSEPTGAFTYYEDMRVLPIKATGVDGGGFYTVIEDDTDPNTVSAFSGGYGSHQITIEQKDAQNNYVGHSIAYLTYGGRSLYEHRALKVIDASVNDDGDIAVLLYVQYHKDDDVTIFGRHIRASGGGSSPIGSPLSSSSNFGQQGDIRYGYVIMRKDHNSGFSISRIDILDQEDYTVFTPRFIALAAGGRSGTITGLVDYNRRFLRRDPINTGNDNANRKDIVIANFQTPFSSTNLGLTHRISSNQQPFAAGTSGITDNTNDVLGIDIDEENGQPYVYMRNGVSLSSSIPLELQIQRGSNPVETVTFPTTLSRGAYIFSVYSPAFSTNSGLAWGTNSASNPHPSHPVNGLEEAPGDINRVYRNLIAVRKGKAFILGHFDNQGVRFSNGLPNLLPSTTTSTKNSNTLIAAVGSSGSFEWSRTLTGRSEIPISIDTDFEENVYFTSTYSIGGARILPLANIFPTEVFEIGIQVSKLNSCGQVFWTRPLVSFALSSSNLAVTRSSFAFSNSDEIYNTLQGEVGYRHGYVPITNKDQYVLKFRDIPLKVCQEQTFTSSSINGGSVSNIGWSAIDCTNPILGGSTFTAQTDGNYAAQALINQNKQYSNAVWLNVLQDDLDFTIVGEQSVCNRGTSSISYEIRDLLPETTYTWSIVDQFLNSTTIVTNSVLPTQDISWTGMNVGTYKIIVVASTLTTSGTPCEITRELEVEVSNQGPSIPIVQDKSYCLGSAPASYHLLDIPQGGSADVYQWSVWQGGVPLNNTDALNYISSLSAGNAQSFPNQLPLGTTIFKAKKVYPNGCSSEAEVSITITPALVVGLDIPTSVCQSVGTLNLVGTLDGNPVTGGTYSINSLQPNVLLGNQLDLAILYPDTYEITFEYSQNGCTGIIKKPIKVISSRNYTISASGCRPDPVYNPNNDIRVVLNTPLSPEDRIKLTINGNIVEYTTGSSWPFSNVSIGTIITAEIITSNPTVNAPCGVTLNTTTSFSGSVSVDIVVKEAPEHDLYLRDNPSDFGQQPSGAGWGSRSIFYSTTPPPLPSNNVIDPYHSFNANVNDNVYGFYYQDDAQFATANASLGGSNLVVGNTNYMSIVIHNGGCFPYGKGLALDAYFLGSNLGANGSSWKPLILSKSNDDNLQITGGLIRIPKDIEPGESLIIVAEVISSQIPPSTGHTCSIARILDCHSGNTSNYNVSTTSYNSNGTTTTTTTNLTSSPYPNNDCIAETVGQDLPSTSIFVPINQSYISNYNNATWKNINFISESQGESEIIVHNGDTEDRVVRVKFDFQNYNTVHYLENNGFKITLPTSLAFRWQQGGGISNNLSTINGDTRYLKLTEQQNGWLEFILHAGESYTLGLSFDIHPSSIPNSQDPVYYLDVSQYNNGELAGGVGFELAIDFIDVAPTVPSNLQAVASSTSEIALTWTDNSDNEQTFVLERNKVGTSTYVQVANLNADVEDYTDSGLEPYTLYQYRLKAISNTGLSSSYIFSNQVRTLDAVPAAPTNLVATLRPDCKVDLTWTDNASNEYRYEVIRILDGVTTTVTTAIPANHQSYVDNIFITEANTYTYQVIAHSATGLASVEDETELVITAPDGPDFTFTVVSDGQVDLYWNGVTGGGTYYLEKKVGSTWSALATLAGNVRIYEDGGVSAGQTYEYRIRSRRGCIFSSYSTQSVTMPAPPVKVSGYIRNGNENQVGNVIVELVDNNGVVIDQFTSGVGSGFGDIDISAAGYYEFDVAANSSFTIRPKKNINMMNGVNISDANLLEKYLAIFSRRGVNAYDVEPYLAIAADLDADCDVDSDDYNLLLQAIQNTNTFSLPSWQFVPSNYDFTTQGYCPFPQEILCNIGTSDLENQDFIGIKTGDITEDANRLQKVSTQAKDEEDTSYSLSLAVIPNPFSTSTQLVFGSSLKTQATIRVYNSLGVAVYSKEVAVEEGFNRHSLHLDVATGLYYVSINGEQINYTSKLVIEK